MSKIEFDEESKYPSVSQVTFYREDNLRARGNGDNVVERYHVQFSMHTVLDNR